MMFGFWVVFGPIAAALSFAPVLKLGGWLIRTLQSSLGLPCSYFVAFVPTVLGFLVANSIPVIAAMMATNFDPEWHAPNDAFDPLSRKMLKFTGTTVFAVFVLTVLCAAP